MKKLVSLMLLIVSLVACTQKPENKLIEIADTIYASNIKSNQWYKKLTIHITDTIGQHIRFSRDKQNVFQLKIPGFMRYPIFLSKPKGVRILKSDSISGVFSIVPLDTLFEFEVWQDYGEDNVVIKNKVGGEFHVIQQNGPTKIGGLVLPAN
ncbi:MAG: hypothetical protein RJQ09_06440 [Cyclobacteriaceae bacterium]